LAVFESAKKVLVASYITFDVSAWSAHGSIKRKRRGAIPVYVVLKL
jgi:hypothetical protein